MLNTTPVGKALNTSDPMHPWMNAYNAALMRGNVPANARLAAAKTIAAAPKAPVAGPLANPLPKPVAGPPDINQFLTNDTTYLQQNAGINNALNNYQTQELDAENRYNTGYAQQVSDLQDQRKQSGIDQQEDYASRGMVRSGLYGVANSNRLNQYSAQQSKLDMGRGDYLAGLQRDMSNYQQQQLLAQQQARQDAINRRALSLVGNNSTTAVR